MAEIMDKVLIQILLVFLISALIGLMDKVKHHWEQTCFSTVTHPDWLVKWLNPHWYLFMDSKNQFVQWLFKHTLAGVGDFWHFSKFLMLQAMFYLAWVSYHEARLIVWILICNAIYGVIFEVVFTGIFNKKDKG
jgi:hypothetical protein